MNFSLPSALKPSICDSRSSPEVLPAQEQLSDRKLKSVGCGTLNGYENRGCQAMRHDLAT